MEILVDVPAYESNSVSVLKYKDGKLEGDVKFQASVLP